LLGSGCDCGQQEKGDQESCLHSHWIMMRCSQSGLLLSTPFAARKNGSTPCCGTFAEKQILRFAQDDSILGYFVAGRGGAVLSAGLSFRV